MTTNGYRIEETKTAWGKPYWGIRDEADGTTFGPRFKSEEEAAAGLEAAIAQHEELKATRAAAQAKQAEAADKSDQDRAAEIERRREASKATDWDGITERQFDYIKTITAPSVFDEEMVKLLTKSEASSMIDSLLREQGK